MEELEAVDVDEEYDISLDQYRIIFENSRQGIFTIMHNFFLAGYMQGRKAGLAEAEKNKI